MKFTDEQKEVLALLPQDVKESNELTDAAKLILANLMLLNGTDFAKNEGYLFRTNQALKEDTGIKSEKTIIAAVNKLIELGFIERKAGQRKSASEYRLNTVKIQEYTVKIHCKNTVKNYSNKLQYKEENTVKNYSNKLQYNNDEILLIINELQNTVKKLQYKITVIEDELLQYKNYSIKNYSENKNYSTDIDIDKEIESETNDNNDNTEEYNINDQNEKEIITEDNLEILKENEILNDEIPSDLPPLDIDSFVEISSNENISDSSKNELEFSIFGNDIISEDENDNDTTVKFINGKFTVVSETEDEINSSSDVEQDNEILNDSNSSDMTMNNSSDTISNNENLSNNDNFEIWGKLQPIYGKTSNVITEYLFTEYENLNDSKNVSDGYHQVKQYISLVKEQINVSVNQTGSFGILSFKDNVYSFIPCNNNNTLQQRNNVTSSCAAAEASKNANTDVKMQQVDNYTTTEDKTLKTPLKMRPVASEDKTVTPTNEEKVEITTNNAPQATEMTKTDNNTTTVKTYTNPDPSNPKVWEYIKLHLTMKQGSHLMRDVLDEYKEIEAKNIHSVIAYMEDMCKAVRSALEKGLINEMQFNDFKKVFSILSKGKYNYWRKVFSTRAPQPLMESEKKMWQILGKPKVTENTENNAETSKVNNYTNGTEKTAGNTVKMPQNVSNNTVVYPNLDELYKMGYDEAIATLQKFVSEHPNLTQNQKVYFNENISAAFGIQLYDND